MKIGIITGSHRADSQSEKVGRYALKQINKLGAFDDAFFLSLGENPLPFWDEGLGANTEEWQRIMGPLKHELSSCDAFIIVTPEWHGMVPAGLKNFLLLLPGSGELAHKPALIVAVSGGAGGAYPVAELRMSGYKNNRLCYLPEHLIVRNVGKVFNEDTNENDASMQNYLHARLVYCLELLAEYGSALMTVRASGKGSLEVYKNGM